MTYFIAARRYPKCGICSGIVARQSVTVVSCVEMTKFVIKRLFTIHTYQSQHYSFVISNIVIKFRRHTTLIGDVTCMKRVLSLCKIWLESTQWKEPETCNMSSIRPDHPRCRKRQINLHMYVSYILQISSKSVQGFRSHRGSNLTIPITLARPICFHNSL